MEAELARLGVSKQDHIINHRAQEGMFSSVRCAAQWSGWSELTTHFVIALGDQPHLRRETLEALMDFATAHPDKICQPGREGHGLHPVVLPRKYFKKLVGTSAETLQGDLLQLIGAKNVELMETDDAGADLDIDSPEDYEKAKRWEQGATGTEPQRCD